MTNNDNKKYVELLWHSKYDKINLGKKAPIERHNLPFQVVETINKPRKSQTGLGDFEESLKHWPENYPTDWKNLLIWGDNKLVMSSLIKQGWAGKINLIYIDPPFLRVRISRYERVLEMNRLKKNLRLSKREHTKIHGAVESLHI